VYKNVGDDVGGEKCCRRRQEYSVEDMEEKGEGNYAKENFQKKEM